MRHSLQALLSPNWVPNLLHRWVMSENGARALINGSNRGAGLDPGRSILPAALALVAAGGTAVLALVASRAAAPLVLMVMAALATVGIFFLFALAARHVQFGQSGSHADMLRCLIDADDDGIQLTDRAGRVLAHNRAFGNLAGLSPLGEINSLETLLASTPAGAESLFRLSRAADRGESLSMDLRMHGQGAIRAAKARHESTHGDDKGDRWIRLAVKPVTVPFAAGTIAARLWRLSDITDERGRQTDELSAVASQLAHYTAAPLGLISADASGRVLFMNERVGGWLGQSGDRGSREQQLADLVADGGASIISALVASGDAGPHHIDLDLVTEAGRRWPATLLVVAAKDRISIAVLERAAEPVAGPSTSMTAESRFSRFFQSAPFGIAAVDGDGRIVNANTAFSRLLLDGNGQRGALLRDAISKDNGEIAQQVEAALLAARQGKANIAPFDVTLGLKGKELTRRIYTASLSRAGSGREAAILYVIDATEAKALEHKVAQSQKMDAVGTLAGGIAHDFNNVLTAIIGFSDLLLQTHKPGNPSYAHILSVKSSANRAAGLVRQLLAFSRRQTLQPKVLQMGDVLTDLSMLVNRLLGEKIELKIMSGRDLWFVKADPSEIERTVINLAVNARDAMLPKGGRLTLRTRNIGERESQKLEHQGIARGEYVLIEVGDTGTGMTPEVMAKIFDPFFTTKAVGKGTGLGLASVYGIVQQTGGYIIPESTPGEGTTFRLYFPRHHIEADEEVEPVASTKKPPPRDLTGTGRILLVEDEDAVRRFAVAALKSKGYEVLQAADGVEAIEVMKANGNRVDIVVSDVIMPEMDGPTLLKELRKTDPKLKFIFVSGYPDDAFKNSLDPEAEFEFLPKPYSLAQIAAKVKEHIGR